MKEIEARVPWSDEDVALAAKLWREGVSASAIANQLSVLRPRNAIIGKMHRLGIDTGKGREKHVSNRSRKGKRAQPSPPTPIAAEPVGREEPPPAPRLVNQHDVVGDLVPVDEAPALAPAPPATGDMTLWSKWDADRCRYPVFTDRVEPDAKLFCGEPVVGLGPYCAACTKLAYIGRPRERSAAQKEADLARFYAQRRKAASR